MGLSAEQIDKIRADLGITQQNMCIFGEMLTELTPGQEHPEDRSLFDQLHATCRSMQTRLVELIDQVDDDKLTADLLEINDDMNNLFLRYDRYEKNKSSSISHSTTSSNVPPPAAAAASAAAPAATGLSTGAIKKSLPSARVLPPISQKPPETPLIDFSSSDSDHPSMARTEGLHKDEDAAHVAEWIGDKDEGITSSEFDKFLAERAAAADNVPRKGD